MHHRFWRAHGIVWQRPDAELGAAGAAFLRQHLADQAAIVTKAINPRHARRQQFALQPEPIGAQQMRQRATVAVGFAAAIIERQGFAERQRLKRLFGFLGERPGFEAGAPERQLGRLDADQAHFRAVFEEQRIAVDHFDGGRGFAALQCFDNGLRPERGERQQQKNKQGQ